MVAARVQFQRDFYRLLLNLSGESRSLRDSLKEALSLIHEISDAERAYLEVRDADGHYVYQSISIPDEDLPSLHAAVSTGIIAEAIRTRQAIMIPSALIDPRFEARESVQRLAIESVLCVPFSGLRTEGVLYLQGNRGFRDAAERIQFDAELFRRHVAPLLDNLLIEQESAASNESGFDNLRERYNLDQVIGKSDALLGVLRSAMMVASLDVTTLLLGETGTGKTLLAKLMHDNSHRKAFPFVELNCAAIPPALLENELFGAVAGGHSSATQTVAGKITAADHGTMFLDEIGDLPLEAQAKLLQFIQSGAYYPLGSSEIKHADVRLIFATNKDLRAQTEAGQFREDLYFRINTFELTIPSLTQRRPDIALLANGFLAECVAKHRFPPMNFGEKSLTKLESYDFPGNLRELRSLVERSCINARLAGENQILPEHLPPLAVRNTKHDSDFQAATQSFQKMLLQQKLEETNWNVSRTARELNLSRSHVHNLINSFALKPEK